jgi:hypothetical protein
MSALKRLLSGQHKLHKHHSLPSNPDARVDYLDLERINRHERSKSKPTTPVSASTPTYQTGAPISGLPITQSPTTSASSSQSNLRYGRSRSRARAKHERAKSLDVRAAQSRRDSLERAERRKNSYENVSTSSLHRDLLRHSYRRRLYQDPLKGNYGQLPLNMSQEGIGSFTSPLGKRLQVG